MIHGLDVFMVITGSLSTFKTENDTSMWVTQQSLSTMSKGEAAAWELSINETEWLLYYAADSYATCAMLFAALKVLRRQVTPKVFHQIAPSGVPFLASRLNTLHLQCTAPVELGDSAVKGAGPAQPAHRQNGPIKASNNILIRRSGLPVLRSLGPS